MPTVCRLAALAAVSCFALAPLPAAEKPLADPAARAYVEGIKKVNEDHLRAPAKGREPDLAKGLSAPARAGLGKLLDPKLKDSPALFDALLACGEASLDLDLLDDFEKVRARLEKSSPDRAGRLGVALSRPRFILRGLGVEPEFLTGFADAFEAILGAYDDVFGFREFSKVPGKKLRVLIHYEEKLSQPPHFAPEFPYCSQIDFPVVDRKVFRSPDAEGHFFFYGLCHELGHAIAMWGNRTKEEDHHTWAHYTGVTIVEHLSETAKDKPFLKELRDVQWRSLKIEREKAGKEKPSFKDDKGTLAFLIQLHDKVGPKAIGAAINHLDAQDKRLRINRVRYYTFAQLKEGLLATAKDAKARKEIEGLFPATVK
jgi:hypothetical protein